LSKAVLDNPAKSSYDLIVVLIVISYGGANRMARRQQRLSALQVTKLTKSGLYGDGGGLTLQITTTGAKSWLFRYMVAGKPFGMGWGRLIP
jgi:hypothetical protein